MNWLGELVVVAAGVLLALWTQQWVDNRRRRRLERRYIASLRSDIEADRRRLAAMVDRLALFSSGVEAVLRVVDGETTQVDEPQDFLRSIFLSYNVESFRPTTTTIDELGATGDFEAFQDREPLRAALAYHRRVEESYRLERFVLDRLWNGLWQSLKSHVDRRLFPATLASFYGGVEVSLESPIPDAGSAAKMVMGSAESVSAGSFDLAGMRTDADLRDHLIDALELHELLRGEYRLFSRLCDEALERFPTP